MLVLPIPVRPRTYVAHARELAATVRCAVLYPFGLAERAFGCGPPAGDRVHDTPVLLVHGYGHNRSGWFDLERQLRRAGFTSVHTMNYTAYGREGVPALAAQLAARVDELRVLTGADRVHVVGHSLGGVLTRWYVQELGGDRFVDTAVTVASPHEGTLAAFVGVGPCARALRPGSRVVRRLAAGARPSPVRWVTFSSEADFVVRPAASGMVRAEPLAAMNVVVRDEGHVGIMSSPAVLAGVTAALSSASSVTSAVSSPAAA